MSWWRGEVEASDLVVERWWRLELVVRGGGGSRGCREVVEDLAAGVRWWRIELMLRGGQGALS